MVKWDGIECRAAVKGLYAVAYVFVLCGNIFHVEHCPRSVQRPLSVRSRKSTPEKVPDAIPFVYRQRQDTWDL
jgi:hypothetical protein